MGIKLPIKLGTAIAVLFLVVTTFLRAEAAGMEVDSPKQPVPTGRYWIFLEPEPMSPVELDRALDEVALSLTPRSLERRRKVIDREPPVRPCDLPVSRAQIDAVEAAGCHVVRQLRYIDAVTVTGSRTALDNVTGLEFVSAVRPVMAFASRNDLRIGQIEGRDLKSSADEHRIAEDEELYGLSWAQSALVNVPEAHERGYRGSGVLIGVQDTGFDNLDHNCFRSLDIADAYDFLNDDDNVADHGDQGRGAHGTRTLSVIAGLDSGRYIGAAPLARYVLTKTENSESETPIEEDYWVAGLWFHDSLGVDVLSSSLSYRAWYDWNDMDGCTAVTSRAADSAAAAGMVIVSSMGNTGIRDWPDSKVGAPADARLVIGAGGVSRDGRYWVSASQGPTYDGRIKPNVSAQASGVYTATNFDDNNYIPRSGTSFSCPMIAGIAALVVEVNPYLTPVQVMNILHRTSSQADAPDTLVGYGIPDALRAVVEAENSVDLTERLLPGGFEFVAYPNPFNGRLNLKFSGGETLRLVRVFDINGRILDIPELLIDRSQADVITIDFSGYGSGVYLLQIVGDGFERGERVVLVR